MVKSKEIILKSVFVCLSMLLFFTSFAPTIASANSSNTTTENAVKILEAMDNSAVAQMDGSILFNENQLEKELKGNPEYEEVKLELESLGLLTNKDSTHLLAVAASAKLNPKWVAARDACAKQYLKDEFGVGAFTGILTFLYAGKYSKAIKELAKKGIKVSPPGLVAVYVHMNYTCIKEANSKHSVY